MTTHSVCGVLVGIADNNIVVACWQSLFRLTFSTQTHHCCLVAMWHNCTRSIVCTLVEHQNKWPQLCYSGRSLLQVAISAWGRPGFGVVGTVKIMAGIAQVLLITDTVSGQYMALLHWMRLYCNIVKLLHLCCTCCTSLHKRLQRHNPQKWILQLLS